MRASWRSVRTWLSEGRYRGGRQRRSADSEHPSDDGTVTERRHRELMHIRRPWAVSFVVAVAVTLPALLIAVWLGSVATTAAILVPIFLVWFVGGGIRRSRLRDRTTCKCRSRGLAIRGITEGSTNVFVASEDAVGAVRLLSGGPCRAPSWGTPANGLVLALAVRGSHRPCGGDR